MPSISLVTTVLNEGESLEILLRSLLRQTKPADEIIMVDGGSTDNTLEVIEQYRQHLPLTVLREVGCNISQGRNLAIAAASGDIIAVTDAGVRIPPDWLEKLTAPLCSAEQVAVVAGSFLPDPDPHSPFEVAMSATSLPLLNEIRAETFLPSSRSVAFRKSAWAGAGGYPEWLDYCEDLIFDLRLKAAYGNFVFAPEAFVYFKPRTSWRAFFKQYYLYSRGDGKADLWRKRHAVRYAAYLVGLPLIIALSAWLSPLFLGLGLFGGVVYLYRPYRRLPQLWEGLTFPQKLLAASYVPFIRLVGDLAKMIGYPIGWLWRRREHPPDWHKP